MPDPEEPAPAGPREILNRLIRQDIDEQVMRDGDNSHLEHDLALRGAFRAAV